MFSPSSSPSLPLTVVVFSSSHPSLIQTHTDKEKALFEILIMVSAALQAAFEFGHIP